MDPLIESTAKLEEFIGVGKSVIARWMAYYDFPKPIVDRVGSRVRNQWKSAEVMAWMLENKEIVGKSQALRLRQKGRIM